MLVQEPSTWPAPCPGWRSGCGLRAGRGLGLGLGLGPIGIPRNPALRQQLGITEDQAAKIDSAQLEFAKQEIQRRAALRTKRLELAALLRAENTDRGAIERKLREINELELQTRLAQFDHSLAVRNLLTAEQRERLKQLHQKRLARQFRDRPGPRRGPRWGHGSPQPRRAPAPPAARPPAPPVER
ncbi:MAG: Spy/CpxP family protein refolding chaperone [Firmicutes bacterium]|nr:Spy/CpxP family protein refolding chaperone [Bacillota bacterium]